MVLASKMLTSCRTIAALFAIFCYYSFFTLIHAHSSAKIRAISNITLPTSQFAIDEQPQNYNDEPNRSGQNLKINSAQPFNAEPLPLDLCANFITPTQTHFIRNHFQVPNIDITKYQLTVDGLVERALVLTLDDVMTKYSNLTVTVTLECAGNRRHELNNYRPVQGLLWDQGAISNAQWTGIRLRDVLHAAGADLHDPTLHVEFLGVDRGFAGEDQFYGASIPMPRIAPIDNDVLLAYLMNGKPLTRDHGYPLRVIVPGYIGARSVKWVHKINVLNHESQNHFMQKDYKILPQFVTNATAAAAQYQFVRPLMDIFLQSAICNPINNTVIAPQSTTLVRGYAVSNGHRVVRVEVSYDNGTFWHQADLQDNNSGQSSSCQELKDDDSQWSWVLWQVKLKNIPVPVQLISRAFDSAGQKQPETIAEVWNFRGVANNAWYRINLKSS